MGVTANQLLFPFADNRFQVDGDNVTRSDDIKKIIQSEGMKELFLMCPKLPFIIIYDLIYRTSTPKGLNDWLPEQMLEWARTKHANPFDFEPSKSVPKEDTAKEYAEAQAKKNAKAQKFPGKKGRNRSTKLVTNTIMKVAKTSARDILPSINKWQLEHYDMYLGLRKSNEEDTTQTYHQIKVDLGFGKRETYLVAKKSSFPGLPEDPSYNDLCKDDYFAIQPCAEHAYKLARVAKDNGLDMDAAISFVTKAVKHVWGLKDTLPTAKVVDADSIDAAISSLGGVKEYAQCMLNRNNKRDREVLDKLVNSNHHHHNQGAHPMNPMPPQHHNNGNGYIQQPFNHPQSWPRNHHHQMLKGLDHAPHSMHGSQLQAHLANRHNAPLPPPINHAPHGKMNPPHKVAPDPNLTRPVKNPPHGKAGPEPKQKTLGERPCSPCIFDVVKVYNRLIFLSVTFFEDTHICVHHFFLKESLLNEDPSTPLVCPIGIVYHIPRFFIAPVNSTIRHSSSHAPLSYSLGQC